MTFYRIQWEAPFLITFILLECLRPDCFTHERCFSSQRQADLTTNDLREREREREKERERPSEGRVPRQSAEHHFSTCHFISRTLLNQFEIIICANFNLWDLELVGLEPITIRTEAGRSATYTSQQLWGFSEHKFNLKSLRQSCIFSHTYWFEAFKIKFKTYLSIIFQMLVWIVFLPSECSWTRGPNPAPEVCCPADAWWSRWSWAAACTSSRCRSRCRSLCRSRSCRSSMSSTEKICNCFKQAVNLVTHFCWHLSTLVLWSR